MQNLSHLDESWIPHGVTQIATEANAKGHDVTIIDGRNYAKATLQDWLFATNAEVMGFSILSAYKDYAAELINFVKQSRPEIKIVVGGIHPTVTDDTFGADYVVKGEGEITFLKILNGEIEPGVVQGEHPDLSKLLPINRTLIKINESGKGLGLPDPFATVIIGRGCPYSCTFCQPAERTLFGKRLRLRPVENVVSELESLGVKGFMVHDDCFTSSTRYVEEFCEAIRTKGLMWWCQGRADNVCNNPTLIRKMRDAGLRGMIIGHESGDDRVLKALNKGATVAQNLESARILKALGIVVWSNIMVGLPHEPPSAVINTIAMLQAMKPDTASICAFTPHPGSHLYDYCKENHLMPENVSQEYYNRGRFEPKIKGPDYQFLGWATQQMQANVSN
jgi:radical SAM superfamily enzyme YgiQ (UPF0313 family)